MSVSGICCRGMNEGNESGWLRAVGRIASGIEKTLKEAVKVVGGGTERII